MADRRAHFVQRPGTDVFDPTQYAQSHWGPDHLNGPALVGLVASVVDGKYGADEFTPARLTVELFKAARGVPTTAVTRLVRDGRRVRNVECELSQEGSVVVRAVLVQYRRSTAPPGDEWSAATEFTPPVPDDDANIYIGSDGTGWTRGIAEHQNAARKRILNRSIDVVAGRANSPLANVVMAAEGTSMVTNMGSKGVGYINGDLTVAIARLPRDEWIGVQADSHWTADGISVGTATLFDGGGPFGTGMVTAIANPAAQIDFANDPFPDRLR